MSYDMGQLSINFQTILDELNTFKRIQEASIQTVEVSYSEQLQEIRNTREKLNAALDVLEKATLKELDEMRTTLQTSLKNDVDNCRKMTDKLKKIIEAATVTVLCDKSRKEMEFIASRKCLDRIQESESYLRKNPVKLQGSILFKANIDIEKYLSQQASLGKIVYGMQSFFLRMNPDYVMTVKSKCEYLVRIPSDGNQTNSISGV
ncbi:hypothetical protein DPMN_042628 [Dreissena polymorpha]|uniref:Uncharacterized protein n=2 Tax=Dreissena polymorpha TaxID=45954 RepID=A0A9D4D2D6_DREPO|nr:hypothetical protein DPMN_042628 [Dreissena polymorpha]